MKFLGIDLGWLSGASGVCCLQLAGDRLEILDLTRLSTIEEILTWIELWVSPAEPALIAVDAPTLIPNATGMRLPDKLTHKYFGRYHAGCYPANLDRPFALRTVGFGSSLEQRGFIHAPTIEPRRFGRYQIEVFPHPAIVHLFDLKQILKYKKGTLALRAAELSKLQQYIEKVLPKKEPSLSLAGKNTVFCALAPIVGFSLKGTALKATEDQLDSLICAYTGAHWWYWGSARNLVLGDLSTGYIVVPSAGAPLTEPI